MKNYSSQIFGYTFVNNSRGCLFQAAFFVFGDFRPLIIMNYYKLT